MFLYYKKTYIRLSVQFWPLYLCHRWRFSRIHCTYKGSLVYVASVPSKNIVSGDRTGLAAIFGLEGGCCSGMTAAGFASLPPSAKGTWQVHGSLLSCSSELFSETFCSWATSFSIGLFSGVSLSASKNLSNRNINTKKSKETSKQTEIKKKWY